MASENSSGTMSVVLVVIAVIAVGVGGYFTGKVIDTKAMEEDAIEQELASDIVRANLDRYSYGSDSFGITFDYSKSWVMNENEDSVIVVSPNNSAFYYLKSSDIIDDIVCGEDECEVFGEYKKRLSATFSEDTEEGDNLGEGEEWQIMEQKDGEYVYNESDGFKFILYDESDLEELDNIMSSLERL